MDDLRQEVGGKHASISSAFSWILVPLHETVVSGNRFVLLLASCTLGFSFLTCQAPPTTTTPFNPSSPPLPLVFHNCFGSTFGATVQCPLGRRRTKMGITSESTCQCLRSFLLGTSTSRGTLQKRCVNSSGLSFVPIFEEDETR